MIILTTRARNYFQAHAGRTANQEQLLGLMNDAVRDGSRKFSGFVAIVESFGKDSQRNDIIVLKSSAHAETTYIFKIAAAELTRNGRSIQSGDKVDFDGRYQEISIKSSTSVFPEILGYITRLGCLS